MKWENISELIESLDFNSMGYLWSLQGESIREQHGAFRTKCVVQIWEDFLRADGCYPSSCIDCLDRTNVVQSAAARHVLSTMLTQLGLIPDPMTCNIESVFNDSE